MKVSWHKEKGYQLEKKVVLVNRRNIPGAWPPVKIEEALIPLSKNPTFRFSHSSLEYEKRLCSVWLEDCVAIYSISLFFAVAA